MLHEIKEGAWSFRDWDPRKNPRFWACLMLIVISAYPCMKSIYNVLTVMMVQFQIGNEECQPNHLALCINKTRSPTQFCDCLLQPNGHQALEMKHIKTICKLIFMIVDEDDWRNNWVRVTFETWR